MSTDFHGVKPRVLAEGTQAEITEAEYVNLSMLNTEIQIGNEVDTSNAFFDLEITVT